MKKKLRVLIPAVTAVATVVLGVLYLWKRPARKAPARVFKTVDDIRPPRVRFSGYDESKAQSGAYAHNNRADLIAARPWAPKPW
jgi:hypothetical protein